ncbi:hypothetical protein DFJ73DRAFT_28100 [Zopfochytrium polystomum]|nr:hypothetical protein DFJ73DRAFT_28100 [Zopfochytrium polystomum]
MARRRLLRCRHGVLSVYRHVLVRRMQELRPSSLCFAACGAAECLGGSAGVYLCLPLSVRSVCLSLSLLPCPSPNSTHQHTLHSPPAVVETRMRSACTFWSCTCVGVGVCVCVDCCWHSSPSVVAGAPHPPAIPFNKIFLLLCASGAFSSRPSPPHTRIALFPFLKISSGL